METLLTYAFIMPTVYTGAALYQHAFVPFRFPARLVVDDRLRIVPLDIFIYRLLKADFPTARAIWVTKPYCLRAQPCVKMNHVFLEQGIIL